MLEGVLTGIQTSIYLFYLISEDWHCLVSVHGRKTVSAFHIDSYKTPVCWHSLQMDILRLLAVWSEMLISLISVTSVSLPHLSASTTDLRSLRLFKSTVTICCYVTQHIQGALSHAVWWLLSVHLHNTTHSTKTTSARIASTIAMTLTLIPSINVYWKIKGLVGSWRVLGPYDRYHLCHPRGVCGSSHL
jgi:hypothetical protein